MIIEIKDGLQVGFHRTGTRQRWKTFDELPSDGEKMKVKLQEFGF